MIDGVNRTAALKYNYGDDIRQKFTGYQRDDETGLDFAEARYYNNAHGRFTAVDPLLASGKSANPQTFNRYVYTMNRPLMLTDSSGLQAGASQEEITDVHTYWDNAKNAVGTLKGYLESLGSRTFDFTINSDQLQNANFGTFQRMTDIRPDAPSRLIGNRGATVDSVLQETNNAYKRAETTANVGFTVSNLFLGAASMVGPGGPIITTNRGFAVSGESIIPTPSGGGTIFTHFTDEAGVQGITGVNPAQLKVGESVSVNQLRFGTGRNPFLASGQGRIFVTDKGLNSSPGELNSIGVFQSTGRQRFGIQFSQECCVVQNDVRPILERPNIFTIPGDTVLNGGFTVTMRYH